MPSRLPLTSRDNIVLADLRTPWQRRRDRFGELAADIIELALTIASALGLCAAFLALLILGGFVP